MSILFKVRGWIVSGAMATGLLAGLASTPALSQSGRYETPPSFTARQVLPPALQQSPYHSILNPVGTAEFLNIYRMKTNFGEFQVIGTELLKLRVREAEAAAKLEDISGGDEMLKAAGRTVIKPLKTGKDLITKPGATVKRTFRGVGRFFGRVGAGMDATDPSRESMVGSLTGAGEAKRQLAYKMGVDPYTQFPPLSEQLARLASASAFGGTATGVGMAFVSGGAGLAISVGSTSENFRAMLRDKTAAELEQIGRRALSGMGVSAAAINAFYLNQFLTPTDKAIIVETLRKLGGVQNRAVFIARASEATSVPRAFALRRRIELTGAYHSKISRITSFVTLGGVPMLRTTKGIVAVFPVDYLIWTRNLAQIVNSANKDKRGIARSARIEIWITGRASRKTAANLKKSRWRLVENAGSRLGG